MVIMDPNYMENERRAGWLILPGLLPYEQAWRWQHALVQARREGLIPDCLILLEHPPTYTLGRTADPGHILWEPAELERRGVAVHAVDRGGDVTYHGPGQLVGYPIVDLRQRGQDVHRYLRDLEEVLIRALSHWGIRGHRVPGYTGVWVGDEKVAAIGVAFRRWVSCHGFALNVVPDLGFFGGIIPCGIADRGVTSLERLLPQPPSLEAVARVVVREFEAVFQLALEPVAGERLRELGLHWNDQHQESRRPEEIPGEGSALRCSDT